MDHGSARSGERRLERDVIIVGGGPAGCALALSLKKRGRTVGLIERSRFRDPRVGEHLAPEARPLLDQVGVTAAFEGAGHLRCPMIRSAWGDAELVDTEYLFNAHGAGWNLDRRRFDALLAEAVRSAGVDFFAPASIKAIERMTRGWRVAAATTDRCVRFESRILVDATGRSATIARRLGGRRVVHDRLMGIVNWLDIQERPRTENAWVLVEGLETGWWYSALLPQSSVVAALMTDLDLLRSMAAPDALWRASLRRSTHTRERLEESCPSGRVRVQAAFTQRLEPACGDQWFAVGDAAAAFDPLSSSGMTTALQSGLAAASAIDRTLMGDISALEEYAVDVRADFEWYLKERLAVYRRESRWADSPFWSRRQSAAVDLPKITLDPHRIVHAGPGWQQRRQHCQSRWLAASDLDNLCALCARPGPAHAAISAFRATIKASRRITDQRVILALQDLVAAGTLTVTEIA